MTRLDHLPRQLDFEGPNNFRDMGGYPLGDGATLKFGILYRSDHLANFTDADLPRMAELGIRTVIDLRRKSEREANLDRIVDPATRQIWLPVRAEGADVRKLRLELEAGTISADDARHYLIQANLEFVRQYAPVYAQFMELLLEPANYPIVFHCSAGKDRAGFAAALILLAAGATRETVFHDYLATNHCTAHYINGIIDGLSDMPVVVRVKASPEAVRALMQAREEYLQAAFDTIEKDYGSPALFLDRGLGFPEHKREQLRVLLAT